MKRIVAAGLKAAEGYDYETKKTKKMYNADGTQVEMVEEQTITNHQPANASLAQFMLCNMSNQLKLDEDEAFKAKQKVEVESKSLTVNISAELVGDQIDRLAGKLLGGNKKQIEANFVEQETE